VLVNKGYRSFDSVSPIDWLVNNYTAKIRLFWKKQEKMRFFFVGGQ